MSISDLVLLDTVASKTAFFFASFFEVPGVEAEGFLTAVTRRVMSSCPKRT